MEDVERLAIGQVLLSTPLMSGSAIEVDKVCLRAVLVVVINFFKQVTISTTTVPIEIQRRIAFSTTPAVIFEGNTKQHIPVEPL